MSSTLEGGRPAIVSNSPVLWPMLHMSDSAPPFITPVIVAMNCLARWRS